MTINHLIHLMERIKPVTCIDKSAEIDGIICNLAGIHHSDRGDQLIVLMHEPDLEKNENRESPRLKTNRDYLKFHESRDSTNPLMHVETICFGDVIVPVLQSEISLYQNDEMESILLLQEFVKAGWHPTELVDLPLRTLYIGKLTLDMQEVAPQIDPNAPIVFKMRQIPRRFSIEYPIRLHIDEDYPERIHITDSSTGEVHWIQINSVYLMDFWAEMQENYDQMERMNHITAEELKTAKARIEESMEQICPHGQRLPVINYETDTDFSIQVYSKAYLDGPHKSSNGAIGFIIGADKPLGKSGNKMKASLIQTPVAIDIIEIDAEIYCGSALEKSDDIRFE
jgi:hypothetical protein